MKEILAEAIFDVVKEKWTESKIKKEEIEINYPPGDFGDYSCNVALRLAKKMNKQPQGMAEEIKIGLELKLKREVEKIEIAGPGFLNFYLSEQAYIDNILEIKEKKQHFGFSDVGKGKKVMVEFGQPNTHKAFHVGHLRSAISGLSVVKLFEALGYEVIKANYYGDVGMHVAKATWGMKKKGVPDDFDSWNIHKRMGLIDEMYVEGSKAFLEDSRAEKEIRQINKDIYDKQENEDVGLYIKLRDWSLEHLNDVFKSLGIEYDRQFPESEVYGRAMEIVKNNEKNIFKKSEGAVIYDGRKDGLTTWVFLTKEGNPTYSAKDLALAEKKFSEYNLDFSVVTTSVEQADYFRVIIHCLELLHPELKGKYKHIPFGWLLRSNKKTSSRMGETVKGIDIIKETEGIAGKKISSENDYDEKTRKHITKKVAMAGLKFLILSHEFHNNINYDPNEFIKMRGFSGPFILYSYVRTQSILKKLNIDEKTETVEKDKISLENKAEKLLAGKLLIFPEIVLRAGKEVSPHIVCTYLYELAQEFNLFYDKCSIKDAESEDVKNSRLLLTSASGQVLKNGLEMLGIDVVEKM